MFYYEMIFPRDFLLKKKDFDVFIDSTFYFIFHCFRTRVSVARLAYGKSALESTADKFAIKFERIFAYFMWMIFRITCSTLYTTFKHLSCTHFELMYVVPPNSFMNFNWLERIVFIYQMIMLSPLHQYKVVYPPLHFHFPLTKIHSWEISE